MKEKKIVGLGITEPSEEDKKKIKIYGTVGNIKIDISNVEFKKKR